VEAQSSSLKNSILALAASFILVLCTAVFALFYALTQAYLEVIPLDWGWLGLVFILVNGYFFSLAFNRSCVGFTERLLLSIGLGFGFTCFSLILLGVSWGFSFSSVLLAQLVLLCVSIGTALLRGWRPLTFQSRNITPLTPLQATLAALICVMGAFALFKAVVLPATEWDSLAYGVNYAKIIFENGAIPLIAGPSIGLEMSASYPPGVQLTAVYLYTFAGGLSDFYYKLLSPVFGLATVLVTYKFGLYLTRNRTFSVFAASLLCVIPFFWEMFIQESYLMALTLMLTSCAYFFYRAYISSPEDAPKYEAIGAVFCGFAALTSYIGLAVFGIPLLYAVHRRVSLRRAVCLIALAFVLVAPWYLRNLALLGNPVYPFFGIGNYLDPSLLTSTTQHFQDHLLIPEYLWRSVLSVLGACLIGVGIVYYTFSKRKKFDLIPPYYLILVCLAIMGLYVAFPRYIVITAPSVAVIFVTYIALVCSRKPRFSKLITSTVVFTIVLSSVIMLPYIDNVKPPATAGEDQAQYLSRLYAEGEAWAWINANTSQTDRIATFDIKEYYLQRSILPLDGYGAAPLYDMNINQSIAFLDEMGVNYVLSVPWACIGDNRMPHAYVLCPLSPYFGDTAFLPMVFFNKNGTAVYHVGPINNNPLAESFAAQNITVPSKCMMLNFTVSTDTQPDGCQFRLAIPVDCRNGTLKINVTSSEPVTIRMWGGLNAEEDSKSAIIEETHSVESPFSWRIDKAGYFTFEITNLQVPEFGVTVNFTSYFEFNS
jgi:hypothetical protein